MIEAPVEKHLVKRVKATGGIVRKVVWPGRRHAPDRLVGWPEGGAELERWREARHALVELKRPGLDARAGQAREHARLRAIGFRVEVLDTIEAVDAFIKEMTK
jgi:hypothetical protein